MANSGTVFEYVTDKSTKSESTLQEQKRVLRLIRPAKMNIDVLLQGPTMTVENLLQLEEGDVLSFDYPLTKQLDLTVNGKVKYQGQIVAAGNKKALFIKKEFHPSED